MDAMTRVVAAVVMLGALFGAAPLAAAPIETGRQIADVNGAPMVVFTYRPAGCSDPSLLMVFHGIARNARTYRDDARTLANRLCLLVVAPLFDRQVFPGWRYQRGGIVNGTWCRTRATSPAGWCSTSSTGCVSRKGVRSPIRCSAT